MNAKFGVPPRSHSRLPGARRRYRWTGSPACRAGELALPRRCCALRAPRVDSRAGARLGRESPRGADALASGLSAMTEARRSSIERSRRCARTCRSRSHSPISNGAASSSPSSTISPRARRSDAGRANPALIFPLGEARGASDRGAAAVLRSALRSWKASIGIGLRRFPVLAHGSASRQYEPLFGRLGASRRDRERERSGGEAPGDRSRISSGPEKEDSRARARVLLDERRDRRPAPRLADLHFRRLRRRGPRRHHTDGPRVRRRISACA